VRFKLDAPNGSFQLYFFASDVCDASGYGEGQVLVHSTMVATDGAGNGTFAASISLTAGKFITATAMNTATNDTSEFSQCRVVAVPGAPAQLAFITQPQDTVTGRSISPPVQVAIQDAAGNTVPDAAYPVNLAIGNNPTGVGNLYGTLTRTAVNGVATFPSLAIDTLAAGYDLVATVNTPPMASHPHSAPFSILPQPGDPDLTDHTVRFYFVAGSANDPGSGGNSPDMMMLVPNRWYDFRVDMDWTGGGKIQFFVDGQMAYQSTMGGASANCHWDGGIYNTAGGTASNKTRTVYLSNLSVGER